MKSKGVTISDSLPAVNSASCCLLGGGRKASSGVRSPGRLLPCLPRQPVLQKTQLTAHRQARVGGELRSTDGSGRLNCSRSQLLSGARGCL